MTIDFECVSCGKDFELDVAILMEDAAKLQCPNCDAKADPRSVEDLMGELDDVMANMAHLRRKFHFTINIETNDLSEPHEPADDKREEREEDEEVEK